MRYSFLLLLFLLVMPLHGQTITLEKEKLPLHVEENLYEPYYDYSAEKIKEIIALSTHLNVTKESLRKWDLFLENYLHTFSAGKAVRVFTYLYAAQADFSYISQEIHGEIKGSLDPLSLKIIRLFFPFFPAPETMVSDEFSIALAEMIIAKYEARLKREEISEKEMTEYFSVEQWGGAQSALGKNILGWLSWVLPSFSVKYTPAPPSLNDYSFWDEQLKLVLKAYENITEEQKKFTEYWGGFLEQGGGSWFKISNDYLFSHSIDLDKILYIRMYLAFSAYDALITSFGAKYTHQIPPPYVRNKKIVPFVEYFYYPSYPSAHAMVSFVMAHLLGHFFPEKKEEWLQLAEKVGQSRVWGGANYPIDIEIAKKVAESLYVQILLEWQ